MATKDVLIDVPILPTLAENKNKENVDPPGFLTIEDAYLDRDGALRKRDGAVEDEALSLASVYTPSFVASYNDDTLVGTTNGIYQFSPGNNPYTTTPSAYYDQTIDYTKLAGMPDGLVEVDSCVAGDFLFIVYVTGNPGGGIRGKRVLYSVYDVDSLELIAGPRLVYFETAAAPAIINVRAVTDGANVSFWWIRGLAAPYINTELVYTPGLAALTLAIPTAPVTFVPVVAGSNVAVRFSWCKIPNIFTGGVGVFAIRNGIISVYTAAVNLVSFSIGATRDLPSLGRPEHNRIECKYISAADTGADECVYVCSFGDGDFATLPPANSGTYTVSRINIASFSFVGTEVGGVILASPNDTSDPTQRNVGPTQCIYQWRFSRCAMSIVRKASAQPRLCLWLSYSYLVPSDVFGTGACTTLTSIEVQASTLSVSMDPDPQPIYGYNVASEAFEVPGRRSEAVSIVRSGLSGWIDDATNDGIRFSNKQYTTAELFSQATVCFVADESPAPALPAYPRPSWTMFEQRVFPQVAWVQSYNNISRIDPPQSLIRIHDRNGKKLACSRVTLDQAVTDDGGPRLPPTYVEVANINVAPEASPSIESNELLFARGGFSCFDGSATSESSVLDVCLSQSVIDITSIPTDTTLVRWSYSWTDARQNIHRAGPSPVVFQGNLTSVAYAWEYPITVGYWPSRPPTSALGAKGSYVLEGYRDDGGVFTGNPVSLRYVGAQRLPEAPHLIGGLVPAGGIVENLYTEGGVLESQSPPSFKDIESGKGRMWGLTDNKLFYTKPIEERIAPEWNYALTLDIPDDTGITTGIGSMDDKVVAFTERGTYVVYGDGPNALGTGGTFAQLLRIPGNIGCIARGSIVECPLGIAFLSQQGFYLLDRGLNLTFIGKPVEASVDALIRLGLPHTIVSAVHDIGNKHVRFIVDSSMPGIGDMKRDHYIWYYETNQWGRFTSFNELQSVYSRGRVVSLFDRGVNMNTGARTIQTTIEQDETSEYGTFVAPLKMKARTGWIDLGNIDGFERVKRFNFLYSPGFDPFNSNTTRQGINVRLYSQFRTTPEDSTHAWDQSDLVTMQAPIDYAGEFSVQPKIQKCASMSIEFEEIENLVAPLTYQGTEVAGLTMRIGKRAGVSKMNIARARRK